MLISIKEIKKLEKMNVGNEIVEYFYKHRNSGYNSDEFVFLPKMLAKKARELGIDDNEVEIAGKKYRWNGEKWEKIKKIEKICRNCRFFIEKLSFANCSNMEVGAMNDASFLTVNPDFGCVKFKPKLKVFEG